MDVHGKDPCTNYHVLRHQPLSLPLAPLLIIASVHNYALQLIPTLFVSMVIELQPYYPIKSEKAVYNNVEQKIESHRGDQSDAI